MVGQNHIRKLSLKCGEHPLPALAVSVCLAAAGIWLTAHSLEFKTDRNDLVSRDQPYVRLVSQYEEEFKGLDDLIVAIESDDPKEMRRFADELAAKLTASTDQVAEVFYRVDPEFFEGKKLLFLAVEDIDELSDNLSDHQDFIEELLEEPSLYLVFKFINRKMKEELVEEIIGGGLIGNEDSEPEDAHQIKFLSSLLRQMNTSLDGKQEAYVSPWADLFGGKMQHDGYITTKDDRYLIMQVRHVPGEGFLKHAGPISFIRKTVEELKRGFPGIEAGVTGQPALGADEMTSAQDDMKLAAFLSLAGVAILYFAAFLEIRRPMLVVICLLIGICWSMGYLTMTVGHLSILTVAFTSILIGLGIDFGFHLLTRYEEECFKGFNPHQSLEIALTHTVPGLFATSITTALAFFAIMLADFQGIRELGWISGGGIMLTFFATIICLPALLMLIDRKERTPDPGKLMRRGSRLEGFIKKYPWIFLGGAVVATALSIPALFSVGFDYNLLNLQSSKTESVIWEKRILESAKESSWFALATSESAEEAERKRDAFKQLSTVDRVQSLLDLVPPRKTQEARIKAIESVAETLDEFDLDEAAAPEKPNIEKLLVILDKVKFTLRSRGSDAPRQDKSKAAESPLDSEIQNARAKLLRLISSLKNLTAAEVAESLSGFQEQFFADIFDKLTMLKANASPEPLALNDVPAAILDRSVNAAGHYLLRIYAKDNIWQRETMLAFVNELRSVDPDVTGPPVVGSESITLMKDGYVEGGFYAFTAILLTVFITFRRVSDTLLCLFPVLIATLWTVGLMWLFGLQFNLANLVVIPLIIGIAVDGGIHMVHRAREEKRADNLLTSSTARAVVLSFLSTMIGFGSLMCAGHQGIYSLGLLLTIAVGSALVVTLMVLPVLLGYVINAGPTENS
jgi:hopanoid biosynthesis associated RND transporter like protein HpnN